MYVKESRQSYGNIITTNECVVINNFKFCSRNGDCSMVRIGVGDDVDIIKWAVSELTM